MSRRRAAGGRHATVTPRRAAAALGCALALALAEARATPSPDPGPPSVDRPGTAVVPEGVPTFEQLEARGATIGVVEIHVQNIFDTSDPRESGWLYRAANRLHIRTREDTVRQQLLFRAGQPVVARRLAETERLLRSRRYLNDAWIVPLRYDAAANVVDVSVTVRDVWTLNPGISFSRQGGENAGSIEIDEGNLLGLGTKVAVSRSKDVDRTSTAFRYSDPHALGTWWTVDLNYADNSDGKVRSLGVVYPFYALDTHRAGGGFGYEGARFVSRYDRGEIVDQFEEDRDQFEAWTGRSRGLVDGWTERWLVGVRYVDVGFQRRPEFALQPAVLPDPRKFVYPWVGWQVVEDRYVEGENLDLIGRTEDLYLGRSAYLEVGWSDPAFGADDEALLASASVAAGRQLDERSQLFVSGSLSGRYQDAELTDVVAQANARWYFRLSDDQLLYAALTGVATEDLDAEQQVLLGGDNGLRGYPLRYQGGSSSALLTLEHRVFTDWYLFRLFRIGGAGFVDVGRTWGRSVAGTEPYGVLADVGVGIRFGSNRSGLGNVLHVDFSYALERPDGLDGFQVSVETRERF